MVGPDHGKGGKFLIALEGTEVPENHRADFVITAKTNTVRGRGLRAPAHRHAALSTAAHPGHFAALAAASSAGYSQSTQSTGCSRR